MSQHKDRQVCRQVYDALGWALADMDDPLLDDLALVAVDPAPDASRVLVTLQSTNPEVDLAAAKARLLEVMGELRAEIAAEITRRRVPELSFHIAPAPAKPTE
jgi:ribosome-binding factor A